MNNFKLIFYETSNKKCPAEEFLLSLDIKMKAKMLRLLEILEEYGTLLREPYSKYLGDGIFELRCSFGNNISRLLYFFSYNHNIIVTNGFLKKSQKTPPRHLKLAKKYKIEYERKAELL